MLNDENKLNSKKLKNVSGGDDGHDPSVYREAARTMLDKFDYCDFGVYFSQDIQTPINEETEKAILDAAKREDYYTARKLLWDAIKDTWNNLRAMAEFRL